jgi:SNF2 family DNA or RNA helicase
MLSGMLEDNVYEFINLMNEEGELFFSDRQANRMERAMAKMEFSFGQGGYQATEFIKRYLPHGYFGLLIVDEGHEYKNEGSAQGQAMGVLARKCRKTILLTGTLMGGYADDLFYLLWRLHPKMMMADGFRYNARKSLGAAGMAFMREHGVIKDIYKETEGRSHRTAKGTQISHNTAKGPGFGPKGIMRFVLPITAFLKLKDIGGNILPAYREHFLDIAMTDEQASAYTRLAISLKNELVSALRAGDKSLLGVVLNVLLAWPDCAFRDELVVHPHKRHQLAFVPAIFRDTNVMPKEAELIRLCKAEKARGRRVLAYSVYTGTRDTTNRLKNLLTQQGLKVAVLRATVEAAKREDWLLDQVDKGVDVVITNPELVKTGLDMLEFPTIVYMQSGYNVYTLQQASRRSWRIGQKREVDVYFLGYTGSAQIACLTLMAKKIAVSQSTSGDMPDSGLDVLNQGDDSVEVALAKQLLAA